MKTIPLRFPDKWFFDMFSTDYMYLAEFNVS